MFDKAAFPFDTDAFMNLFKPQDFSKYFADFKVPGLNTDELLANQKKNFDALVAANQSAATGYQTLFKKQMKIFEETMSEAQSAIKEFDVNAATADPSAQAEFMKAAFEKGVANMKDLAETAQKANTDAYEIVSARVKDSVADLAKTYKA